MKENEIFDVNPENMQNVDNGMQQNNTNYNMQNGMNGQGQMPNGNYGNQGQGQMGYGQPQMQNMNNQNGSYGMQGGNYGQPQMQGGMNYNNGQMPNGNYSGQYQGQNMNNQNGSYGQPQMQNMGNQNGNYGIQGGNYGGQSQMNYNNGQMPNGNYGNQAQGQMGYGNPNMNPQNGNYGQAPMQNYGQPQMNYGQTNPQMNGYGNSFAPDVNYNNYGMQQGYDMNSQGGEMALNNSNNPNDFDMEQITAYKRALRQDREVQNLTSEVNIDNPNSIIMFGQGASENISKVSDQLLHSMKAVKAEEASEMLTNLTNLMDKFDVKELEGPQKQSMFSKLLKGVGDTIAKLFEKYDNMGNEVEKIYVLLKRYESEIKEANGQLKKLYDANLHYYKLLEKYIVAGEMAGEEVDSYISQIENNPTINQEQKQMMIQKLQIAKDMLSQRVYDLQIAENVAIQAAPMIQTIQMSNFNLMRKINSSFIVTLPIFKQCLAQAIILKRQEIQAKSIKQLDEKTNELIMRNAQNTARQSVEIAKMASGSSIAISTLEKSYETIMKGIEDTKAIQEANRNERIENAKRLEVIKHKMKQNIPS
ncbi:toxic anion resistance protein [Clostridium thermobutyricum]|uniref:TelA-like protein n=1 Tax=Clostridium thermobutyricum DSM 4928 TaxID=1121339 RepID=A0A1V4SYZ7_9CLOT|nr:toxic anion resistance protein [Clostridium thermobutyricum]OPX49164.1 TelA-like protein [Clostridium thermobutyricum DSM 4928]